MSNNLHICYQPGDTGQNYEQVADAIKELGDAITINEYCWFVSTSLTAAQARDILWPTMKSDGSLYIVDSKSNLSAWQNLPADVGSFIKN